MLNPSPNVSACVRLPPRRRLHCAVIVASNVGATYSRGVSAMRMRITGCAVLVGLLFPLAAQARATGRVSGVVTSDAGQPVPNAQITVQASTLRALTDSVGRYIIG